MPTRVLHRKPGPSALRPTMAAIRLLDPVVLGWLEECRIEGHLVRPGRIFERYEAPKFRRAMEALGASWFPRLGAWRFEREAGPILAQATGDQAYVDLSILRDQLDTPGGLADQLVAAAVEAGLKPGAHIAEPSAGNGSIIRAAIRAVAPLSVLAIEIDLDMVGTLQAQSLQHTAALPVDFLEWAASCTFEAELPVYDAVLMHPPARRQQDIPHIRQAWEMVKPGGCLAALCSVESVEGDRPGSEHFRAWLVQVGAAQTKLPVGCLQRRGEACGAYQIVAIKAGRP